MFVLHMVYKPINLLTVPYGLSSSARRTNSVNLSGTTLNLYVSLIAINPSKIEAIVGLLWRESGARHKA